MQKIIFNKFLKEIKETAIDEIILFSGDSDFDYLIKKLHDVGKNVTVFSSRKMISWELKMSARKYVFIEDLKNIITRK